MPIEIHSFESGNTEYWIVLNNDGTITYHEENAGWTAARRGAEPSDDTMTVDEAKKRWPQHAGKIDRALAKLKK